MLKGVIENQKNLESKIMAKRCDIHVYLPVRHDIVLDELVATYKDATKKHISKSKLVVLAIHSFLEGVSDISEDSERVKYINSLLDDLKQK